MESPFTSSSSGKRKSNKQENQKQKIEISNGKRVIARLSDTTRASLHENVILNTTPALEISSSCKRLSCFNSDGTVTASKKENNCTRYSLNKKGYVQIKTTYGSKEKTNEKVQLQALLIWFHPEKDYQQFVREYLMNPLLSNDKLEISHLCGFKLCANAAHMCLEKSSINKSRIYCPVWTTIAGSWYFTCQHQPPCIYTTCSNVTRLTGEKAVATTIQPQI